MEKPYSPERTARVNVKDLGRPDDLPFRVPRGDLVPIGTVAGADPLSRARVAVTESEELEARCHSGIICRQVPQGKSAQHVSCVHDQRDADGDVVDRGEVPKRV